MKRTLLIVGLALAVLIPAGWAALATQINDAQIQQECASLYGQTGVEYADCVRYNSSVQQALAPTISATSVGDRAPIYWCGNSSGTGKSTGTTPPPSSCKRPIVCTWHADNRYHCVDDGGAEVVPNTVMCATNADYACYTGPALIQPASPAGVPPVQAGEAPAETSTSTPAASSGSAPGSTSPASPAGPAVASPPGTAAPSAVASATPAPTPALAADDPVSQALLQARARGLRVWLEADLVRHWKAGPPQLNAAIARLASHARSTSVAGVKMAYDLGLHDLQDPAQIRLFVTETSAALRHALPPGRQIAIDVVVPELGCGANQRCVKALRDQYPWLTLAEVERYVLTGAVVDAVNVTGGLFTSQYTTHKITQDQALRNLWTALRLRSWGTRVPGLYLGARELGLAHPRSTSPLTKAQADAAVKARVDVPLQHGMHHVVLWTWRQTWDGMTWRVMDEQSRRNAVWDALRARAGLRRLAITYDPRETERSVGDDIKAIADVAGEIFIFFP